MIHARAPMRISFAGGGSDLPAFCREEPGAVLGVAVQVYMHLFVSPKFDGAVRVSYSRTENVATAADVEHDIARETLAHFCVRSGVEVVSVSDVPAGTGLGSSSAYAVALASALHVYTHAGLPLGQGAAAELACHIEQERCRKPVGRQDQYLAAYGGLRFLRFEGDTVRVEKVPCGALCLGALRDRLMLFYLGTTRDANGILARQQAALAPETRAATRQMAAIATQMRDALTHGVVADVGELLGEAWLLKRELAPGITNGLVDQMYARALMAGARGGKLCGAGGSGFLLVYAEPERQHDVRQAVGLRELPVKWDLDGVQVWGDRVALHD